MTESPTVYRTEVYIVSVTAPKDAECAHPSVAGANVRGVFYSMAEADAFVLENNLLRWDVNIVQSKILYTESSQMETRALEPDTVS